MSTPSRDTATDVQLVRDGLEAAQKWMSNVDRWHISMVNNIGLDHLRVQVDDALQALSRIEGDRG